jgi:hypothetical protein
MLPHFGRRWYAQHWHLRVSFHCCAPVSLALFSSKFGNFFCVPLLGSFSVNRTGLCLLNVYVRFGKENCQYYFVWYDAHVTFLLH